MAIPVLVVLLTLGVGSSQAVDPPVGDATSAADVSSGLQKLATSLGGLDGLGQLANNVPFTDAAPTAASGLVYATSFANSLKSQLAAAPAFTSLTDLQSFLNDPARDVTLGSGVHVDIGSASLSQAGGVYALNLTLTLSRAPSTPLKLDTSAVNVDGGSVALTFGASLDLTVKYDPSQAAGNKVYLDESSSPAFDTTFAGSANFTSSPFHVNLGFTDVTVGGSVDTGATIRAGILDPDSNGKVTESEIESSAPQDLFDLSLPSSHANASLTLSTDIQTPLSTPLPSATITVADSNLANGLDTPSVSLGSLGDFKNMQPQDFLSGLASLAVMVRSLEASGPAAFDLPFLHKDPAAPQGSPVIEHLADVVDFNKKLVKFFQDNGLSGNNDPLSLNLDASKLATVDTAQEVMSKLEAALGISAGTLGLAYDPTSKRLLFTVGEPSKVTLSNVTAHVDFGDQLKNAGITDSTATVSGGADATVHPSYSWALKVGVDMSPAGQTPVAGRFFVVPSQTYFKADLPITATLDMAARIGFLGVSLKSAPTGGPAGNVQLLAAADGSKPMVQIKLKDPGNDQLSLQQIFDAFGSDQHPFDPFSVLDASDVSDIVNAAVPSFDLKAAASIGDAPGTTVADGAVNVGWSDITDPSSLSLTADANFNENLLDFDFDPSNPAAMFTQIMNVLGPLADQLSSLVASNPNLQKKLPVVNASFADIVKQFDALKSQINDFATSPAGFLQEFESMLQDRIAAAISNTPLTQAEKNKLVNLEFVDPPGSPTLLFHLAFGVCGTPPGGTPPADCTISHTLSLPLNFDLPDVGGLVGVQGSGSIDITADAIAKITFGIKLPEVSTMPGQLPGVSGAPQLFIDTDPAHTSIKLDVSAATSANTTLAANVGPIKVQLGKAADPESACNDTVDNDGDNVVNDGCPPVDAAETNCNDTNDDDTDGAVNDGCPAVGLPIQAKVGAKFHLEHDTGGDHRLIVDPTDLSNVTSWLGDTVPSSLDDFRPATQVQCDNLPGSFSGGPDYDACASLPVIVGSNPDAAPAGYISFATENLFNGPYQANVDSGITSAILAQALDWGVWIDGLDAFTARLEKILDAGTFKGSDVPVVGKDLSAGAQVVQDFRDNVVTPLKNLKDTLQQEGSIPNIQSDIQTTLYNALHGAGLLRPFDANDSGDGAASDIHVDLLCGNDEHVCGGADTVTSISDASVSFAIGGHADTTFKFDTGLPGLQLRMDNPIHAGVDWRLDVMFGLSKTRGFYLRTNEPSGMHHDQELTLDATVDLPENGITGDIAFLRFDISNNNTALSKHDLQLGLAADIKGGQLDSADGGHKLGFDDLNSSDPSSAADVAVELSGNVDINLHVVTSVNIPGAGLDTSAGMPKLDADFILTWGIGAGISLNGGVDSHIDDFNISFENIQLDLGQFFSGFLGPVVREVQRFTKPLQPVIDTISAPIPGISDLSELAGGGPVTMIDFLEKASGADLTLVKRIIQLVKLINNLPTSGTSIPLGDFDVLSDVAAGPALTGDSADRLIDTNNESDPQNVFDYAQSHGSITSNANVLSDSRSGGLSFPAFENPKQLFQLLVGKDVKLIEFDAGTLRATASFDITIGPFPVGPVPVSIIVGGSFGVEGHFAIGYGTHGIRLAVKNLTDPSADHNGWNVAALLFDGVFLDDLDPTGVDVPEIRLFAEIHAGAEVDIVIASAGIEVGLKAEVDLNLHDGGRDSADPTKPAPTGAIDGVLYIDELASMWNNPICMFDVDGKLTFFVKFFITIGISPFDASFDVTLFDATLLDMKDITASICSKPPPPHLAEKHGSTLVLKMGPYVTKRNVNDGNIGDLVKDEKFTVRQLDNNAGSTHKFSVTAFGIVQEYDGISKIFADGGDGDDAVTIQPGSQLSNNGGNIDTTTFDVTVPVELCGGPGVDSLQGGTAADTIVGDGGETSHASNWGSDGVAANAGSMTCSTVDAPSTDAGDKLSGNGGNDTLYGNGGDDTVGGGDGDDTAYGGPGNDTMQGGQGADNFSGGADNDSIGGGPEVDPASAQNQTNCNDGNPATLCVTTAMVSDTLSGDDGKDTISAEAGDDHVFGGANDDTLNGASGNDDLHGQSGADTISAGTGNDQADGGPGNDLVFGEDGSDSIRGGPDNDRLVGGKDNDNIDGQTGDDLIYGDDVTADSGGTLHETGTFAGNDTINGGDDHDVVFGQNGDDTINGGNGPDELHGENGADTMNGDAGIDTMFGDNGADTMNGGTEDDTMRGGNDADVMHGNDGIDTMFGDQGADQMFGDAGADVMHGNGEADLMHGGTEGDTMNGDSGTDTMFGDAGNDAMHGDANDDYLEGNADTDTMTGDAGQDDLIGGSGSAGQADAGDTMYGGDGVTPGLPSDFDVLVGDNGKIERPGGAKVTGAKIRTVTLYDLDSSNAALYGSDTMSGDQSDDELYGGGANDTIHGNGGDDYAEGNPGNDSVYGDQGQDDLIGGTSQDGGGHPDGSDCIQGDERTNACGGSGSGSGSAAGGTGGGSVGGDVIAGDNASITRSVNGAGTDWVRDNFGFGANGIVRRTVTLFDVETVGHTVASTLSGGDTLYGDDDRDLLWGQGGADTIHGGAGDDYAEGNQAGDQMFGDAGNDDLVGGSEPAGRLDAGDTISGGPDFDVIAGDNASLVRTLVSGHWVQNTFNGGVQHERRVLRDQNSADEALVSGGDTITGDDQDDLIYGQGGDDTVSGGNGDDTIEGNSNAGGSPAGAGSALPGDAIHGDAGQDDIVGGTTQPAIYDGPDTIYGDTAEDAIAGDNATIDRPTNAGDAGHWFRDTRRLGETVNVVRRNITLLDVDLATQAAQPASVSGGDAISGGDGYDQLFGQGGGDTVHGDAGDDYAEGNAGADTLWGDLGDDDLTGGGSANDGVIDADRVGEDLRDGNDTIHGDAGDPAVGSGDAIAGDNARILRPLTPAGLWRTDAERGATLRDVMLFDVEKVGGAGGFTAPAAASGVDTIYGEGGPDVAFGQGNGGLGNDWGTESGAAGTANCFDGADNSDANDPYNPLADLSDPNCRAATPNGDQLFGQGGGDYLEGNQGSDVVAGGEGEDDVVGGSSSNDGHIDAIRTPADRSGPVTAPANLLDGNDVVQGDAEDDTVLGDNGFVDRYLGTGGAWIHINSQVMLNVTAPVTTPDGGSYGPYDLVRRNVTTTQTPESAGAFGSDLVYGGDGNDDLYGMLGHDWIEGGPGEDGVVADMGHIDDNLLGTAADGLADPATLNRLIKPNQPFIDETIDRRGVLKREVKLFAFTGAGAGIGNDTVQGNDGSDWIHTGPGDDLANGNAGEDRIFGDDNTDATPLANNQAKVDALWGGEGHDHIWGGYGADFIDVRPRTTASAPGLAQNDPPAWFQLAGPGIPDYEGRDYIYGGWDQDAMQADFGDNGPAPGDRLMDWSGSYNVYYVCPSTYGDWISTRAIAPGLLTFLNDMSQGDGAFNTATSGTSGFRETGLVYTGDVKNNTNPVHPDTPGHFTCGPTP